MCCFWSNSLEEPQPPPSACGSPGRGGKGTRQSSATVSPGVTPSRAHSGLAAPVPGSEGCSACQRSQPAAPSRPGTAPSPLSSPPGVCGAGRQRCGCQQLAEPGGRKEERKDSSSPCGQLCPSPPLPHMPLLCAGSSLSLFWLSHGVPVPLEKHLNELLAEGQTLITAKPTLQGSRSS